MNEDEIMELADLFKLFGDSTRLRIMSALYEGEVTVTELAERLSMTASAVSHQLKVLRNGKLIRGRRDGKQMYYALADDHVRTIIAMGREHIEED